MKKFPILLLAFTSFLLSCESDDSDTVEEIIDEVSITDEVNTADNNDQDNVDNTDDDNIDDTTEPNEPIVSKQIKNLAAPQTTDYTVNPPAVAGDFVKFDFKTGESTNSETNWDIAFRGTTIIVNGGVSTGTNNEPSRNQEVEAAIATGLFKDITSAEGLSFLQDAEGVFAIPTGSDSGWYNYAGHPTHLISPIPGKVLVFKTHSGNYAKVEILSYYLDLDDTLESRNYTFNYVFNPNEGNTSFK